MKSNEPWGGYHFIGGNLALDFVNTLANRLAPAKRIEYLRTQEGLNRWMRLAGFKAGRGHGVPLRDAVGLREALYRILAGRLQGAAPRKRDLQLVNRFVRCARAGWKLTHGKPSWRWGWAGGGKVSYPLARVVEAAAELLTSADLGLLRQCNDAQCGWLFLDRSHGHRRKWCSMEDCGNRAKVRRFFARKK